VLRQRQFQSTQCTIHTHNRTEQNMQPQYPLFQIPIRNRYQHCNYSKAQADSSLMMVYVNLKHVGATVIILNDFNGLLFL